MRTAKPSHKLIEQRRKEEQKEKELKQLKERLKRLNGKQLSQQDKDDLLIELARQHGLITE
jgi:hypothetical protein